MSIRRDDGLRYAHILHVLLQLSSPFGFLLVRIKDLPMHFSSYFSL